MMMKKAAALSFFSSCRLICFSCFKTDRLSRLELLIHMLYRQTGNVLFISIAHHQSTPLYTQVIHSIHISKCTSSKLGESLLKLQFDVLTKLVCNCVKRMKQDTPPRRVRCADDDVATRVFVSLHTESCLVTRKIVVIWTLPAFRCITLQRRLQQQQETLELQKRKRRSFIIGGY